MPRASQATRGRRIADHFQPFPLPDTLVLQSDALQHPSCGRIPGTRHTDDALQLVLLKAKAQGSESCFCRQTFSPPGAMQLRAHFDLVGLGPVVQLVQTNPANPLSSGFVGGSPGTKPVALPLLEAAMGNGPDPFRWQVSSLTNSGGSPELLELC